MAQLNGSRYRSPNIRVGCCGFPVRKAIYYRSLSVVEVQRTFYQLPELSTARRWKEEAPSDFEFTLKAWQLITHEPSSPTYRRLQMDIPEDKKKYYGFFKATEEVEAAWLKTAEFARVLGAKKIVFQCPASFRPTDEHHRNLRQFFKRTSRGSFAFVWEPRGHWPREEVERLCVEFDLLTCVDPFKWVPAPGCLPYLRLHGRTGYRYKYSDEDMRGLVASLEGFPQVYVMFNNISMYDDALRFKKFCEIHP